MISRIQNEPKLKSCIRYEIEDEGIEVGVDEKLTHSEYAGVKVDDYYNELHDATPPKATDYVVAVDQFLRFLQPVYSGNEECQRTQVP